MAWSVLPQVRRYLCIRNGTTDFFATQSPFFLRICSDSDERYDVGRRRLIHQHISSEFGRKDTALHASWQMGEDCVPHSFTLVVTVCSANTFTFTLPLPLSA